MTRGGYSELPPPLSEGLVTYSDGTPASVEQMSQDVAAFLMWTAEPKLMARKATGLTAVLFLVVGAFNSLHLLSKATVDAILLFDTFLLATAMAALGLRTHIGAIRQAGMRPMLLAAALFAYLVFGGLAINLGVRALLG